MSPLLANVALRALDERYARHAWDWRGSPAGVGPDEIQRLTQQHRDVDRRAGRSVLYPVRYADDFLILVAVAPGPGQETAAERAAIEEKAALAAHLKETLNLELSEEKTLITPVTEPIRFLGHHVRVRAHPDHGRRVSTTVIPKERSQRLRKRIKDHFRCNTTGSNLEERLRKLNPALRGWCNFYMYSWGAKRVFGTLDYYIWWTIYRWLKKKHDRAGAGALIKQYGRRARGLRTIRWGEGSTTTFVLSRTKVRTFNPSWLMPPSFVPSTSSESPVHNERCTPCSVRAPGNGPGENRGPRRAPTLQVVPAGTFGTDARHGQLTTATEFGFCGVSGSIQVHPDGTSPDAVKHGQVIFSKQCPQPPPGSH